MLKSKMSIIGVILLTLLLPTIAYASIDVYFSLADDPEEAIIEESNNAKESIDIAMYYFTDRDLANTVIDAHTRGVRVRIYLDKDQRKAKYSKSRYLAKCGISIRYSGNPYIMHHKFAVIDNEVVITGSYNWTASAGVRNNENLLIIYDTKVAQEYLTEFNQVWRDHYLSEKNEIQEKGDVTKLFKVVAVCFRGNLGGKDEWIVIRNISNRTYNLKNWYIADNPKHGHKFKIEENVELIPSRTLAITNTEKSEFTVPYDKLYCLHKNIYWWNNDGDTVRLINPGGDVVVEVIMEINSPLRVRIK